MTAWVDVRELVSGVRAMGLPLISAAGLAEIVSSFGEQADRAMSAQAQASWLRRVMVHRIAGRGWDSRNRLRT